MFIGLGTLVVILLVVAIIYFVRRASEMSGVARSPGEPMTQMIEALS